MSQQCGLIVLNKNTLPKFQTQKQSDFLRTLSKAKPRTVIGNLQIILMQLFPEKHS